MCTKLIAVDRLGSGVRVSAISEIFALTAGGNVLSEEGNCPGGANVRGEVHPRGYFLQGAMSYTLPT